jgi:hypothetical protein
VVRVERRVYVEYPRNTELSFGRDDVALLWSGDPAPGSTAVAEPASLAEPVECELAMPVERREAYLVVCLRETMEVVTILETLSPGNKRPDGDGRREYLEKRDAVLQSPTNLVELDLLRGGRRLPMAAPLRKGDSDVPLDLQAAFDTVYDRARYDLSLNYAAELDPPLGEAEAQWVRGRVAAVVDRTKGGQE